DLEPALVVVPSRARAKHRGAFLPGIDRHAQPWRHIVAAARRARPSCVIPPRAHVDRETLERLPFVLDESRDDRLLHGHAGVADILRELPRVTQRIAGVEWDVIRKGVSSSTVVESRIR